MTAIDPAQTKAMSEAAIKAVGGESLATLPFIDLDELNVRTSLEAARRALVLNILVHLSFGAPPIVGHQWLATHGLLESASDDEVSFLNSGNALDEQSKNRLRWNIEPLWVAVWAGNWVSGLTPTQPIDETLASLLPNLRSNEAPDEFIRRYRLRSLEELYPTLDLFYRAHWYARNCQLNGKNPAPYNLGVVQERRRFLEWITHAEVEWEDVDLST